jgi:DNA-binding response OmpR family regulator
MAHIMVVNDSVEFLQLMEDLLTDQGYEVSIVEKGAGTRAAAKRLQPDLLIIDVRMPDLDGFEVLNLLQLDPETAAIPVLVCTAAVQDVQVQEPMLRDRGIPVLFKPFDIDELLNTVRRLLDQSPAEQQRAEADG